MKSIRLILACLIFSTAAFSQACPKITSSDIITLGPGQYRLTVTYTSSNGQNHILDSIYCGNTLIFAGNISVNGDGSYTKDFTCTGNPPSVVLLPGRGNNGATCGERVKICPSCGPVPVIISAFAAQRKNENVLLSWQTEMELNSSHFDILKSSDNFKFDKIGTVSNLAANSNIVHNYSFTDYNNTSKSVTYYKLKIVDIDGKITYSDIKTVKGNNSGKADFVIFPNPAVANSSINISGITEPTLVQILDNSARVLKSVNLTSSNSVELSGIQSGNYIIRIQEKNSGETTIKKLVVVN